MQLMRLAEAPTVQIDREFRYSPAWALAAAVLVMAAGTGLIWIGWRQQSGLAYYLAGALFLGVLLMRRSVLARFRPSNWLLRLGDEGLFVQFRSYLNHRLPAEDLTVAFIPYREIRAVRRVDERRDIPSREPDGRRLATTSTQRRRLVELELAGASALAEALAAERAKRPVNATLHRHYPVRAVSAQVVQVEWNVVPGAKAFLEAMRRHTRIAAPVEILQDYSELQGLGREDQEKRIVELAETGQTIAAIHLARVLYSYDPTRARAFVEGLLGAKERSG